ncbi:MAG TPA: AMP-binding protein [Sphingomicrobium sp.]|nr:AMP-binding protein [Sphingomicrobium sp.]
MPAEALLPGISDLRAHSAVTPIRDLGEALVGIARQLHEELSPQQSHRLNIDAVLDRDWGFDSLSRAELFLRIERAFGVSLPERLLTEAQTLRELKDALALAPAQAVPAATVPEKVASVPVTGEGAPAHLEALTNVLDWHAEQHGDKCHAIILGDEGEELCISYGELREQAQRAAAGVQHAGAAPGDRVSLMLPTGKDYLVAYFGCLYAGAVPTPIYPPARPAELAQHLRRQAAILRNADAKLLIVDERVHAVGRLLQLQVGTAIRLEKISELARELPTKLPHIEANQPALLQYTSGSTGDPKGVILTHANLIANIRAIGEIVAPTPSDVFVSWLPLYHDMGLIGAWLSSVVYGVPLVLMSPVQFLARPERWLWAIHRHRGTLTAAPNFAYQLCIDQIDREKLAGLDLSSVRMAANGSEPVSPETLRRFLEWMKPYGFRPGAMCPAYGLAENGVGLAISRPGSMPVIDRIDRRKLEVEGRAVPVGPDSSDALEFVSCGQTVPATNIRIVGPAGELSEREEGELEFRGSSATSGYLNNPDRTRDLFDGSWLKTGDLAYISNGSLFVTGRTKDIIIRAGQHIYPQEVEERVGSLPGLRRGGVVAFGSTDVRTGTEKLVVIAETSDRRAERLAGLRRFVAEAVGDLLGAAPEDIVLVPLGTVPKTASGKIRRSFARQLYESQSLTGRPAAVRWQLMVLSLEAGTAQARRLARSALTVLYGIYWWLVVAALGFVTWPLILLLRRRSWRWAVLSGVARLAFAVLGVRLRFTVEAEIPDTVVLVANHSSYLDSLVLAAVLPHPLWFVAKRELASQFIAGPFLQSLGTIFVERELSGAIASERTLLALEKAHKRIVIYPEGTFTSMPGLQQFHLGAFALAATQSIPVVPVAIRGTRSILSSISQLPRRGSIDVWIGSSLLAGGRDFADVLRLRDAARDFISAHCGESEAST